jgi:CDP-diacylglycerol--glycerol-3-phosphate 3-phosphatidyltransferase
VSAGSPAFGPTAIATPANALTLARLIAAPAFAVAIDQFGPRSWWLWLAWIALTTSDGLDGHIARRHGTTRSGAFLDPLADKFLVLGALAVLAATSYFSWVPVLLIAAREVTMSLYRVQAGRHGISIPASRIAKLETLLQDFAIGFCFFPPTALAHPGVARVTLWIAVGFTLYTGGEYYLDGRRLLHSAEPTAPAAVDQRRG